MPSRRASPKRAGPSAAETTSAFTAIQEICARTNAVVQHVGKVLVLWRPSPEEQA
jgi:RNA-binding protein YhbY